MPEGWVASEKALFGAASRSNVWISVTLCGAKAAREFKFHMLGICISNAKQNIPAWMVNLQFIYALKLLTAEDEKDESKEADNLGSNLHKSQHEKLTTSVSCYYLNYLGWKQALMLLHYVRLI